MKGLIVSMIVAVVVLEIGGSAFRKTTQAREAVPAEQPVQAAAGAQNHQSRVARSSPLSLGFDIEGRAKKVETTVETEEHICVVTDRFGHASEQFLMPPFYKKDIVGRARFVNSCPETTLETGTLHVSGQCPTVVTSKVKAVGVGTSLIVQIDPASDPGLDDDVHRVYFLGPSGGRVDILDAAGTAVIAQIRAPNKFVIATGAGPTVTGPFNISDYPALEDFVEQVCSASGHSYPHP
jgi:hypothetical protein